MYLNVMNLVRFFLFWCACIPARLFVASLGNNAVMSLIAALIGIWWLSGMETTRVGRFGGPAFWADIRPLHGLLWLLYAITGNCIFLYVDLFVGVLRWLTGYAAGA